MSTIKSRRRWIRFQWVTIALLLILVFFPGSPKMLFRAISNAPVYQKIQAQFVERYLQHRIAEGDTDKRFKLAYLYYSENGHEKYVVGDPAKMLRPLVKEGNLTAIRNLSFLIKDTDPEQSRELLLRAADMGDFGAQITYLKRIGIDMSEPGRFVAKLYEMQSDRPGWKISFNRMFRSLQDQANLGNSDAQTLLDSLAVQAVERDA